MNMGVAIRPSALMATLAAPCIACFDRRLMVAAGPRILVRQRAHDGELNVSGRGRENQPRSPPRHEQSPERP
jgi:hypothetical protein